MASEIVSASGTRLTDEDWQAIKLEVRRKP